MNGDRNVRDSTGQEKANTQPRQIMGEVEEEEEEEHRGHDSVNENIPTNSHDAGHVSDEKQCPDQGSEEAAGISRSTKYPLPSFKCTKILPTASPKLLPMSSTGESTKFEMSALILAAGR